MTMNDKPNDIDWLAFRYIANELDSTEATEFESRLETDQAARQAVALAVREASQLHAAITEAAADGPAATLAASSTSLWNVPATRIAVIAGSCLTLLLAVIAIRSTLSEPLDVATHPTDALPSSNNAIQDSTELAFAWAQGFDVDIDEDAILAERSADSLESEVASTPITNGDQPLVAPSWMLAALSTMDRGIDSDMELQE